MKQSLLYLTTLYATWSIGIANASATTKTSCAGHKQLVRHIAAAKDRTKQGYGQSALSGAKTGAATGFIGAALWGTAVTEAMIDTPKQPGDFERLILMPYVAGTVGGAGAGALAGMWREAFYRNTTPQWAQQMELLANNNGAISEGEILYLGVPTDQIDPARERDFRYRWTPDMWFKRTGKQVRKAYLVSSTFDNLENAYKDNHYELYLMPNDWKLINTFLEVNSFAQKYFKDVVDFIAMRPTPGISTSPYNGKNLPRIIVGFKNNVPKKTVIDFIWNLHYKQLKKVVADDDLSKGTRNRPRYSHELEGGLMHIGYGSPDFKDSKEGQKKYADKRKGLWFWQSPSDEAMAFRHRDQEISSFKYQL